MKKETLLVFLGIFILAVSMFVIAKPDTTLVPATNNKADVPVIIPSHAVQIADNVFSLGISTDVDGRVVQGFMFVDDRRENAKPGTECGNGICEPGENANKCPADCGGSEPPSTSTCYSLFAKGARWKTTEPYVTGSGIDLTLTEASLNTWDSEVSFGIFGVGSSGVTDGADDVSPDGKNEVMFENLGPTDTIAYTIVWGIFYGKPSWRELIEWDVVFNSDYPFGTFDNTTTVMDYQNIATHEFGHSLGLGHPDDSCTEETMYRFSDFNETKKRDLNAGDITGINELY